MPFLYKKRHQRHNTKDEKIRLKLPPHTDLSSPLGTDLLLGLCEPLLGQFGPAVTVCDERLQVIHSLMEISTVRAMAPKHFLINTTEGVKHTHYSYYGNEDIDRTHI